MTAPDGAPERSITVIVCRGPTCGDRRGSAALYEKLRQTVDARGLHDRVTLAQETCFGHCLRGPNVLVCDTGELGHGGLAYRPGPLTTSAVIYNHVTVADLERLIDRHLAGTMVVRVLPGRPAPAGGGKP